MVEENAVDTKLYSGLPSSYYRNQWQRYVYFVVDRILFVSYTQFCQFTIYK